MQACRPGWLHANRIREGEAAVVYSVGVSEISYQGRPALRIPYLDAEGKEIAVRFRTSLTALIDSGGSAQPLIHT